MNNQEYDVTFGGYYWRGKHNFQAYIELGAKPYLFYSAFEYRCCIERILLEHLVLLRSKDIPKSFLKLYRAKDIGNTILEIEPDFYRKIEYINIFFEAGGMPNRAFIPDLRVLNNLYGRIGQYLHAQKEPENTVENSEWWDSFLQIIEDVDNYFKTVEGHDFGAFDFNERGLELFNKWKNCETSEEEVIQNIRSDLETK